MYNSWLKNFFLLLKCLVIINVIWLELVWCSSSLTSLSLPSKSSSSLLSSTLTTIVKNNRKKDHSGNGDLKSQLIRTSAHFIKNRLFDRAAPRATTSSQVIEYNARNIVLMTLLNSFLILGGLLGTMNRPEFLGVNGLPFKRKDPSTINHHSHQPQLKKYRFWNKANRNGYTTPSSTPTHPQILSNNGPLSPTMDLPMMQTLIENLVNLEYLKDLQNTIRSTSSSSLKPTNELILANSGSNTNNNIEYAQDIFPRMLVTQQQPMVKRRNDQTSSTSIEDVAENCALLIHCKDINGKSYYPSLSMLTKTALQLVNEDNIEELSSIQERRKSAKLQLQRERRKPKSMLMNKVKEMVEIEQKNNSKCEWKQLCQV